MEVEKSIVSNSSDSSDKCKLFRYLNVVYDNEAKLDKTRHGTFAVQERKYVKASIVLFSQSRLKL